MSSTETERLSLEALDTVLARATVECWTELALLGPDDGPSKESMIRQGWPRTRVLVLSLILEKVPPALAEIDSLTTLYLAGGQIGQSGAEAIARLAELTSLDVRNNRIGDAGAIAISRLANLTSLDLRNNQIGDAGAIAIGRLANLTSLDLRNNQIGDAGAQAIARANSLISLNLEGNRIGDAGAQAVARLARLASLHLANNHIGDAGSQAIARLTALTSLHLAYNQIGDAGAEAIASRTTITSLDLGGNRICDAGAKAIARLTALNSLQLGGNQVGDAGAEAIARLAALTSLDLGVNHVSATGARAVLGAWADPATAGRRKILDLRGNDDLGGLLPAEVLEQTDAQALIAAWRRFREAEAAGELRPLNEAKVLVVGEEAVGKTSLVRFLVDGVARDDNERKTPGIVIRRDVPIADWSEAESEVRLHFWDFGGQEIMHQTHRYFLTRRSLYLLVLEDRREDDRSVYDWLKVIKSRGGDSPVVVVINKCDEGAANLRLDETGIRAAHPNVVDFVAVSCNAGAEERIAGLRRRIASLAVEDHRLTHVRDPFPREQLRVKREIVEAASATSYLSRAEFVRICETADDPALRVLDPNLQHSLLQLLHDLGTVVAHGLERQQSAAAREVTLLDPNWLTEAIYKLLNSKRILDQGGAFDASDMAAELDPERFPPDRHGYIIEMMQEPEIGLCFRLPGQGEPRWLMPECLPRTGPDVARLFEGALRFRFTYDFLPAGLVPRFIVEAYNKFTDQPTRWRTGALLEVGGCPVLVRGDLERHRIDLVVTGPEARRRSALAAVLHDLEAVHKLNPEIGTEARVPLPDEPEVDVGYDHLLALEKEEGRNYSYLPEKAKRKHAVWELLDRVREGVHRSTPVAPDDAPPLPQPRTLAAEPWFPFACGGSAALALVVLLLIPSNEWRTYVAAVLVVFVGVTLVTMHYAPGRYYRRLLSWVILAGLAIHAAGFSAVAGFWGESAASLHWDGRVGIGFSLAWVTVVIALIIADLRQTQNQGPNPK